MLFVRARLGGRPLLRRDPALSGGPALEPGLGGRFWGSWAAWSGSSSRAWRLSAYLPWGWRGLRRAKALPLPPARRSVPGPVPDMGRINAILLLIWSLPRLAARFLSLILGVEVTGRRLESPLTLLLASVRRAAGGGPRFREPPGWAGPGRNPWRPDYYAAAGALGFLLSFGPSIRLFGRTILPGPYGWVYAWMPGFKGLRGANRFSILLFSGPGALCGLCRGRLAAVKTARRGAVARGRAGRADHGRSRGPSPCLYARFRSATRSRPSTVGRRAPGGGLLVEIPMPARDDEEWKDAWPVYYSTYHWKSLVNGYSGSMPPAYRLAHEAMQGFPSKAVVRPFGEPRGRLCVGSCRGDAAGAAGGISPADVPTPAPGRPGGRSGRRRPVPRPVMGRRPCRT